MHKKRFIAFLLITLISTSLLWITPPHANAAWFGEKSFAAAFTSFFSRVKSLITNALTPQAAAPAVVQASCIPSVPARPAGIDSPAKYGSLTITPEVSTAGPNNIITISATTNLDTTETLGGINFVVPIMINKDDLLDWYPKDPSAVKFTQFNDQSKNTWYGWGVVNDKTKLPARQTYWVKIRMLYPTIPERAKDATNAHGWRKISYHIGKATNARGFQGFYIGREQKPSLITIIPNYTPGAKNILSGTFSKPFQIITNGYFEIQTKSLGQPGMITMKLKNAKIIGGEKREIKADETITWKIQPLGTDPVRLLELGLANTCGEDYFVDPAKSARLADFDKFTFPVVYDTVAPKKSEPQPKTPMPTPPTPKPAPVEQSKKVFPQNLVISQNRSLAGLREGDKIVFTAKLVISDGSTQVVKTGVKWTLIGQVGNITPDGVFTAKLDEAVAEYGEGSGIVTATYVDVQGTSFIGKTPTFRVETFMPDGGGGEG